MKCDKCGWEGDLINCPICCDELLIDNNLTRYIDTKIDLTKEQIYQVIDDRFSDLENRRSRYVQWFPRNFTSRHLVILSGALLTVSIYLFGLTKDQQNKYNEKIFSDFSAGFTGVLVLIITAFGKDDRDDT